MTVATCEFNRFIFSNPFSPFSSTPPQNKSFKYCMAGMSLWEGVHHWPTSLACAVLHWPLVVRRAWAVFCAHHPLTPVRPGAAGLVLWSRWQKQLVTSLNAIICTLHSEKAVKTLWAVDLTLPLVWDTVNQTASTEKVIPWKLDAWKGVLPVLGLSRNF